MYLGEALWVAGMLVLDMSVIAVWYSSFGLNAEEGVLEGMNKSGVSMMPWNKLTELVYTVRPRTK